MLFFLTIVATGSYAYDITDRFAIGGVLAGAYQYQWVDGDENTGRGALFLPARIQLSAHVRR
ncbi:hypothetical protein D1AOALGA4SA_1326 [Olavius algarvensis Delta 1 endosymbiont]|nr:hypothetical protein D1AOALGA4SA_1326 [Olavius algarvensis Delta 1 endosymbiont]